MHTSDPGAAIAALVSKGYCLLIRQPDRSDPVWKFLGGKVEPGESVEAGLVRELDEETGFKIPLTPLASGVALGDESVVVTKLTERSREWPRPHVQHFFVVEAEDPMDLFALDRQVRREDEGETIETRVFRLEEVVALPDFLPSQRAFLQKLLEHLG